MSCDIPPRDINHGPGCESDRIPGPDCSRRHELWPREPLAPSRAFGAEPLVAPSLWCRVFVFRSDLRGVENSPFLGAKFYLSWSRPKNKDLAPAVWHSASIRSACIGTPDGSTDNGTKWNGGSSSSASWSRIHLRLHPSPADPTQREGTTEANDASSRQSARLRNLVGGNARRDSSLRFGMTVRCFESIKGQQLRRSLTDPCDTARTSPPAIRASWRIPSGRPASLPSWGEPNVPVLPDQTIASIASGLSRSAGKPAGR